MADIENKNVEALIQLQKQAFERFKSRRDMEWKVCLSLWTVLVILLGLTVKGDIHNLSSIAKICITISILLVSFLHFNWIKGISRTYALDNRVQAFFEKKILETINLTFDKELEKEVDERVSGSGSVTNWYHAFHLGITILLAVCVIFAIWILL